MSRAFIKPYPHPLQGTINLPGDKSLSHRRALLSLFVEGNVRLTHCGIGEDFRATLFCLERLGKKIVRRGGDVLISGDRDYKSGELDCKNSGTTARLLMGILAAREGKWILYGDSSLSRRPMERVAEPLRRMGAMIDLTDGCLPARIEGATLHAIEYESPISSAQVKSAVLLAACQAEGASRYREPFTSRDHTEIILGLAADESGWITLNPKDIHLSSESLSARIPSDPSSSAFWVVAALCMKDSEITIPDLLVNPRRVGFVDLLRESGAKIELENPRVEFLEPVADLRVFSSNLVPFAVENPLVPDLIDEIPALAVLAAACNGKFDFKDVGELRQKETDRIHAMAEGLRSMGARVVESESGFSVEGNGALHGAEVDSFGDHRVAMSLAVAALLAEGESCVYGAECVGVSYPEFWDNFTRFCPGSLTMDFR